MAEFNGLNKAAIDLGKKVPPGDGNGHVKSMADKITFAQAVYAIADIVNMGALIPKGAKVKGVHFVCPSLGTTGILTIGYAATTLSAEAPTALSAVIDVSGQATATYVPVLADALTEPKQVILKFTEATTAATGLVAKVNVEFVVD